MMSPILSRTFPNMDKKREAVEFATWYKHTVSIASGAPCYTF